MTSSPEYLKDITAFHKAMGLPLLGLTGDALEAFKIKQQKLINEELFGEFMPAYAKYANTGEGIVDLIDAICDSIYVVGGMALGLGYSGDYPEYGGCDYSDHVATICGDYEYYSGGTDGRSCLGIIYSLENYGIHLLGVDKFYACWREVHKSNMAKTGGYVDEYGKYRKPAGWQPPDLKSIIEG